MILPIIQMILTFLFIALLYFVFLWVDSVQFTNLNSMWEGLVTVIISITITYCIAIFLLALINKLARLGLSDKEGELTPFEGILWGLKETAWDIAQTLTRKFMLHSPFPFILARLFGLKQRKGTTFANCDLMDPEFLDIGEGTLIGTRAIVSGHHIRDNKIYRKKTIIGKNCTIGGHTIILPGAKIGDNVLVGAVSLVPANWVLESNSLYSGVPVKKVKDLELQELNEVKNKFK